MKLIAGLGNPGLQYRHTRHNLGFVTADLLAEALHVAFTRTMDNADVARAHCAGDSVMLVKPKAYMNNSGRAVASLAGRYGCAPEDMLVLLDDAQLPLGSIRLRPGGSAGGHNGLKSIIAWLGSQQFHRLRMGIRPEHMTHRTLSDFVLGRFAPEEQEQVAQMTARARDAALCWLEHGIEIAMSRYN